MNLSPHTLAGVEIHHVPGTGFDNELPAVSSLPSVEMAAEASARASSKAPFESHNRSAMASAARTSSDSRHEQGPATLQQGSKTVHTAAGLYPTASSASPSLHLAASTNLHASPGHGTVATPSVLFPSS